MQSLNTLIMFFFPDNYQNVFFISRDYFNFELLNEAHEQLSVHWWKVHMCSLQAYIIQVNRLAVPRYMEEQAPI